MCGIAGKVFHDGSRPVERDLLARMAASIRHRGPDDEGIWTAPGVGLVHRRLAVILQNPPEQLKKVKEKYRISSFFNWNNDYYGAPEGRNGSERIWLYNGSLIKWMSGTNRDGSCKLPEKEDLVRFLDRCLTGDDTRPGC